MLDPLTALGLAGSLIQVIQFSYDIVSEGNKLYHDASGVLTKNKPIEDVSSDLADLSESLKTKQEDWRVAHGRKSLDPDELRLRNLCDRCIEVANELQIQLNKLKAKEGRAKRLRSYKQAVIAVWRKDKVQELERRLEKYREEVDTRILFSIRQSLQDSDARTSKKFAALDQRTKDLATAVLDHHGSFDTKLDSHTDLLAQIFAGQIKTHELLQAVVDVARTPSPAPPKYEAVAPATTGSPAESQKLPLHRSSASGKSTKVRQLLRDSSVDVNARDDDGCTPLHLAANAETAKYLLRDKRIDHSAEDHAGRSALHYAVLKRRLDVIKALLDNNVDKKWKDDKKKTAAFYAQACPAAIFMLQYGTEVEAKAAEHFNNTGLLHLAWLGDKEGTQYYLDQGAIVDARNDNGETALTESSRHGHVQIVEILLEHGADTELAADKEWTPLLQAIRDGREAVVPLLLRYNAKKEAKLGSGNNALAEACLRKRFGIARILIEAGSHVDTRDSNKATPLFRAAFNGNADFVRYLLQQGADVEAQNDASLTPLYVACKRGHSEVAALLLEAGASHQVKSAKSNWTPLAIAANLGRTKCVRVLLQHGADPNVKGNMQYTPTAEACWLGHRNILKQLIAAKADLEATDGNGFTLLGVAARHGQDDCIRILLDAGANIDGKGKSYKGLKWDLSPLMRATRGNHPSTIELLVQRGINVEARNRAGQTALVTAAELSHVEAVRMLLTCGADVHAYCDKGRTALHEAAQAGSKEIVRILLDAKANVTSRDWSGRTPWIMAVHHHKEDLLRELLEPDVSKEEALLAMQRDKRPGDVAKHMNKIYQ